MTTLEELLSLLFQKDQQVVMLQQALKDATAERDALKAAAEKPAEEPPSGA